MSFSATGLRTVKVRRADRPRMAANGPTTQRFFADGDLHEGTQWKYAQLPPDDAVETARDAGFQSFDKIPRKHRMVLAFLAIAACLLIASAAWTMMFRSTGAGVAIRSWASALRAPRSGTLRPADAPVVARPPWRSQPVEPLPTVPKGEAGIREPSSRRLPVDVVRQPKAVEESPSAAIASRPPSAADRATRGEHHGSAVRPLRGFVWSPTTGGLVPAVPARGP